MKNWYGLSGMLVTFAATLLPLWLDPGMSFHGNTGVLVISMFLLVAGGYLIGFGTQLESVRFLAESRDWWVKNRLAEDAMNRELIKKYEDAHLKVPESLRKG